MDYFDKIKEMLQIFLMQILFYREFLAKYDKENLIDGCTNQSIYLHFVGFN
jgi:hypothetical protein